MRIGLIAASGVVAVSLLIGDNALAQDTRTAIQPAVPTFDADTQARIAKARALMAAHDEKDFFDAVDIWTKLAEQGVPEAEKNLGEFYHYGSLGAVCRDDDKAVDWYTKAANQGVVEANRKIGEIYAWKKGPVYDPVKAAMWFQRGADLDDMESQHDLGEMFGDGEGVAKDQTKSIYWLERAASHPAGDFYANMLGDAYSRGENVPRDDGKALHWYVLAANKGQMDAMSRLGAIYEQRGDAEDAYKWYALLAALDRKDMEHQPPGLYEEDMKAMNRAAAKLSQADRTSAMTWVEQSHIAPSRLEMDLMVRAVPGGKYCGTPTSKSQ